MPIELLTEDNIDRIIEIEKIWGDSAATEAMILSRLKTHPQGCIGLRTDEGSIEGCAFSQRVNHLSNGSWARQTDDGFITATHIPDGIIAYGVGMSATPQGAKYGVAKKVIEYYYDYYISQGRCSLLALGSRVPGFAKWHAAGHGTVKEYIKPDSERSSRDPELRLYKRNGFRPLWEMPNYFNDPDSLNYGVMIVRLGA